jgi:hypothetical protein
MFNIDIKIAKPETFDEYQMFLDNLIGAAEKDLGVEGTDELLCFAINDKRRMVWIKG